MHSCSEHFRFFAGEHACNWFSGVGALWVRNYALIERGDAEQMTADDIEMTEPTELRLRLSARERDLLSEYGYPFEDFGVQLSEVEGHRGTKTLIIVPFYLGALLADIVHSAKEIDDEELLEELDALYFESEAQSAVQGYRS